MNWKRGKTTYLIGFEGDARNGYTIKRSYTGFKVHFIAKYNGEPIASDGSIRIVKRACEAHCMQLRGMPGGLPEVMGVA